MCGYPFQGVPATNIRAELLAATKALEKCLQILEFFAPCQILLLTDSAYVLQVLEGGRSGLHMCLCKLVLSCCGIDVRTKWWLGTFMPTRGTALNEIADRAAKEALEHPLSHYFMRRMDYTRAYMPVRDAPGPHPATFW